MRRRSRQMVNDKRQMTNGKWISAFRLPTAYCLLRTAYRLLPTAYCVLPLRLANERVRSAAPEGEGVNALICRLAPEQTLHD